MKMLTFLFIIAQINSPNVNFRLQGLIPSQALVVNMVN
jgi:hypothetical protein